jgi:dethiobiotin synthetase
MSVFITGTDTGVGKTHCAVLLAQAFRAAGHRCAAMKPICCGDRRDAELLLAASDPGLTIDEVNPIWLRTPLAPYAASLAEELTIDPQIVKERFVELQRRFDVVLVEGVGGWLVPIRADYFVADLAVDLQLPVVVVARNRLGCLNHTLLTVRSIQERGLRCAAVLLNDVGSPPDLAASSYADILRRCSDVMVLENFVSAEKEGGTEFLKLVAGIV